MELGERRGRRIQRLLKRSELPSDKTLGALQAGATACQGPQATASALRGRFRQASRDVLAFGLPGRGKTHLACAIGHELVQRGYKSCSPGLHVVRRLLVQAKPGAGKRAGAARIYDAIIMDDIGYVQQSREEMEVLFTFLAERYERRSVMITSNLVFSQWDQIFKDKMTTMAAIDRLVHHAIILEMTGPSIREEAAKERSRPKIRAIEPRRPRGCSTRSLTRKASGWGYGGRGEPRPYPGSP